MDEIIQKVRNLMAESVAQTQPSGAVIPIVTSTRREYSPQSYSSYARTLHETVSPKKRKCHTSDGLGMLAETTVDSIRQT